MKKAAILGGHGKLVTLGITSVALVALATGTMVSMALFTDTETDENTFTTGTIVLDATKIAALNFAAGTMMPGDNKIGTVEVENDGTAELRYAVTSSSTNTGLSNSLMLVILEEDADGGCDDADGAELHASGALGASGNEIGNPAQGADSGDRVLGAGANEVLCFYVSLALSAPNSAQGLTSTTTFTFAAEQTANN